MALIRGYVKDLNLVLPLLRPVRFTDRRNGDVHDGWLIAVRELTLEQRATIYEDCRNRFQDLPPEEEFWNEIVAQNGLPIRAERVDVAYDLRGFV